LSHTQLSSHRSPLFPSPPLFRSLGAAGFETPVWSLEPESGPQATLLASAGIRYVGAEREPLAQLGARLGRVDVLYEATGAPEVVFQALAALGHNAGLLPPPLPPGRPPPHIHPPPPPPH